MKTFCVTYTYTVHEDVVVKARNEKEAREKFKAIHPEEKITNVWETFGEWVRLS